MFYTFGRACNVVFICTIILSTPSGGGEGGWSPDTYSKILNLRLPLGRDWVGFLHRIRESKRQILLYLPIAVIRHLLNAIVKARIEEHLGRDISAEGE